MVRLQFAATIADIDHWTDDQQRQYNYDQDRVEEALREAMLKAGNDFVAAHPEMFRVEVT